MIDRYCLPAMRDLWTPQARYASWVEVEVLASEAQAELGTIPAEALAAIRAGLVPAPERVAEFERTRDHEVLAFLAAYTETIPGGHGRWVHYGMTSYDLVDTALGHTLARACDLMLAATSRLRQASTLAQRRPVDDAARFADMVRNANLIVAARIDGRLVGIARSVTDGAYVTYLSDIAVDPIRHRGRRGIPAARDRPRPDRRHPCGRAPRQDRPALGAGRGRLLPAYRVHPASLGLGPRRAADISGTRETTCRR